MTATLSREQLSLRIRLRIEFLQRDRKYTMEDLSETLSGLNRFLILCSLWHHGLSMDDTLDDYDKMMFGGIFTDGVNIGERINDTTSIESISYNSPLVLLMSFPGMVSAATASAFGAAKGALYLVKAWQQTRVEIAKSEYEVAAYKFLRDEFVHMDIADKFSSTPRDLDLRQKASRTLADIEDVSIQSTDDGLSSDWE